MSRLAVPNNTPQSPQLSDRNWKRERTQGIAISEGLKWGTGAMVVSGAGTVAATMYSKNFAKFMSISAKTSIPMMFGLFVFSIKFEHTISAATRSPEDFGLSDEAVIQRKVSMMPIHHSIMNSLYDHPFIFIAATGGPFAGYVLSQQMKLKHLTISQRVMHSRVIAQAGIITLAMTTMAFREFMERRGMAISLSSHYQ